MMPQEAVFIIPATLASTQVLQIAAHYIPLEDQGRNRLKESLAWRPGPWVQEIITKMANVLLVRPLAWFHYETSY